MALLQVNEQLKLGHLQDDNLHGKLQGSFQQPYHLGELLFQYFHVIAECDQIAMPYRAITGWYKLNHLRAELQYEPLAEKPADLDEHDHGDGQLNR